GGRLGIQGGLVEFPGEGGLAGGRIGAGGGGQIGGDAAGLADDGQAVADRGLIGVVPRDQATHQPAQIAGGPGELLGAGGRGGAGADGGVHENPAQRDGGAFGPFGR